MILLSLLLTLVNCSGQNDTAAIQGALAVGDVEIVGDCVVPGQPGISVGSNRVVDMHQATLRQGPNLGSSLGRNRMFETQVGAEQIVFRGGRLIGSREPVGGLQWSIGIRVDSAKGVLLEDVVLEDWYTDGIYIGGNLPGSSNVRLQNVTVRNSKRNGLSIVCGSGIRVIGSLFEGTSCNTAWKTSSAPLCSPYELNMPMTGIDFEPNSGDIVQDVVILDSIFRGNQKGGIFLQSNQFLGGEVLMYGNSFEGNGTIGLAANQVSGVYVIGNSVQGGTLGYSFGNALKDLVFVNNKVAGNSGNATNLAGVWDPYVARFDGNGKPIAIIAIPAPWLGPGMTMGGVAGNVILR